MKEDEHDEEFDLSANEANEAEGAPHILAALLELPLFDELFLRMQATNISIVDGIIEPMETDLLRELIDTETPPLPSAMAVSAMSQMWMFAVYELLRTWRQRVRAMLRIHDRIEQLPAERRDAALESEAAEIQGIREESHLALDMYRASIKDLADAKVVGRLRGALDAIEPIFRQVESLRVTLAKHEVPKTKGLVAFAPGYGRIDYITGSMYWQIDLKDDTVDVVNRRRIADELRRLRSPSASAPPNDS